MERLFFILYNGYIIYKTNKFMFTSINKLPNPPPESDKFKSMIRHYDDDKFKKNIDEFILSSSSNNDQ